MCIRDSNDLVELMALAATGRVEMLTQTYPLDAVNDAMDDLDAGRMRGRGILVPASQGAGRVARDLREVVDLAEFPRGADARDVGPVTDDAGGLACKANAAAGNAGSPRESSARRA